MKYCKQDYSANESIANSYKILIVEDSEFVNKTVYKALNKNSFYSLDQAFDFAQASQKLQEQSYDFIILDLNLPDAYGEELVADIQQLSKAKIIILTAEADKQIRESLYKSGILDYIVKDKKFSISIASIDETIKSIAHNKNNNILIIDDSMFLCKQLQKVLNISNYTSDIATTATIGLEKLNDTKVDLIILDMELPDIHGLEVLEHIGQDSELCHIPVIVISGHSDPELVRKSLKSGASNFIKKPFNIEEFILKVNIAIDDNDRFIELKCKQKLLDEYKSAIDDSAIVSKTDAKGIITFVNDKFCEISGYTREELVGQNQNKVRHPDTPSSVFKEMWTTIQNKKHWSGKIKNLKKDGGFYFVQSTINPIVDYNNNIIEYIGIRTDITELEIHKMSLSSELDTKTEYIRQYEHAISNMVPIIKTDKKNRINFANEAFIKISGYSMDELIGLECSELRDEKHILADDCKKINLKVMKNRTVRKILNNVTKDGESYIADIFFYPITDADNNVVEVLHIMNDITEIYKLNEEISETQKEIIYLMGEVGETHSKETGDHVKRVAEYSKLLALLAGLGSKKAELLFAASPMHDIGKVAIPDNILKKPGKLTDDEWICMKTHSEEGYNILKGSSRPLLKASAIVAYRHHEKWDGSGYPNGLAGEKIHIFGRITAIADVFDALGSNRVYKKAWELDRILELFKQERGKHFDPALVDLLFENIDQFVAIRDRLKK